jgi:hypothetical protein
MNLVALITPFHLRQYIKISNQEAIKDKDEIIFYSIYIDRKAIQNAFPDAQIHPIEIPSIPANFFFDLNFYSKIKSLKIQMQKLKTFLYLILTRKSDVGVNLFFFTEKDFFTQYLIFICLKFVPKDNLTIITADEGTGNYIEKRQLKGFIKKIIYKSWTGLILKFPYSYYRILGTHPKINIYYARLPEKIPFKSTKIKYKKILPDKTINPLLLKSSNQVLILPNPLTQINEVIKICEEVVAFNLRPVIKPHPRENISQYENISKSFQILDNTKTSESLKYSDYILIINFRSSAIIDLLQRGYPENNIITYTSTKPKSIISIFNRTQIINNIAKLKMCLKSTTCRNL